MGLRAGQQTNIFSLINKYFFIISLQFFKVKITCKSNQKYAFYYQAWGFIATLQLYHHLFHLVQHIQIDWKPTFNGCIYQLGMKKFPNYIIGW